MQRRILPVLFAVLFLVMLGFGSIIPVMPFWAQHFGATAVQMGLLMAIYSFMQFLFSPLWGAYSDRVGRRPVLLLGLAGYVLTFFLLGEARTLWHLYAIRALAGLLSSATLPTAMAMVGDTTTEQDRAKGMGLLGAAMGLGMIFGPGIGGLLSRIELNLPFLVSAGLGAVTLVFAYFLLPESLPAGRSAEPGHRGPRMAGMLQALQGPLAIVYYNAFFVTFSVAGLESTFGYLVADRLGLGPGDVGGIFVAMGLVVVVIQGGLVGKLVNRFGEVRMISWGLFLTGAGFLAVLLAWNLYSMMLLITVFGAGSALLRPSVTTLISKRAPGGQGAAIGLMDAFDSLGRVIGPVAAGALYKFSPAFPYLSGSLITFALLLIFSVIYGPRLAHRREAHEL